MSSRISCHRLPVNLGSKHIEHTHLRKNEKDGVPWPEMTVVPLQGEIHVYPCDLGR